MMSSLLFFLCFFFLLSSSCFCLESSIVFTLSNGIPVVRSLDDESHLLYDRLSPYSCNSLSGPRCALVSGDKSPAVTVNAAEDAIRKIISQFLKDGANSASNSAATTSSAAGSSAQKNSDIPKKKTRMTPEEHAQEMDSKFVPTKVYIKQIGANKNQHANADNTATQRAPDNAHTHDQHVDSNVLAKLESTMTEITQQIIAAAQRQGKGQQQPPQQQQQHVTQQQPDHPSADTPSSAASGQDVTSTQAAPGDGSSVSGRVNDGDLSSEIQIVLLDGENTGDMQELLNQPQVQEALAQLLQRLQMYPGEEHEISLTAQGEGEELQQLHLQAEADAQSAAGDEPADENKETSPSSLHA